MAFVFVLPTIVINYFTEMLINNKNNNLTVALTNLEIQKTLILRQQALFLLFFTEMSVIAHIKRENGRGSFIVV